MLTGCHRGLSKVVSWCGDTTVVWTQPVAGIEILSCVGEGFFTISLGTLCRNLSLVLQEMLPLR